MRRGLLATIVVGALVTPAAAEAQLEPATFSLVPHEINRVFLRITNRGGYGFATQTGDVGNFPRGTPNRYLFGTGLWIGGVADIDGDGDRDTLTSIAYNPSRLTEVEWIEGTFGFSPNDARFRVLDSSNPSDMSLYPAVPVADQELFTMFGDRFSVGGPQNPSVPIGIEVRQRSFAYDEPGLDTAVLVQWDVMNVSDQVRSPGYPVFDAWIGIVLDPDIGFVGDDTAAPLSIDGEEVLLVWDTDFAEAGYEGRPGFLAVVPLAGEASGTTITQLTSASIPGILPVPQNDVDQYRAMVAEAPWTPTIVDPAQVFGGFDLRALIAWGPADFVLGGLHRSAAAFVWSESTGEPPERLSPLDPSLSQDAPFLADLVTAVRSARQAYQERLAGLPPISDFPGDAEPPTPGEPSVVLQNYPNPFDVETTIEYVVAETGDVRLEVYDLNGQRVARLASGSHGPGRTTVVWDGRSEAGFDLPAGIYVIRLETASGTSTVRALKVP